MTDDDRVPAVLVALDDDADPFEFADEISERDDVIAAKGIVNGLSRSEVEEDAEEVQRKASTSPTPTEEPNEDPGNED